MNKDFNVKDFVEEYERQQSNTERSDFLEAKLKCEKYIPYGEKLIIAENIIQSTSHAMVKDGDILRKTDDISINSPMRYVLFATSVVNKYTNIDVNLKSVMTDFDYLNKNGLIEVIFDKIGQREIGEFNTLVEVALNDFITNRYELKNHANDTLLKILNLAEKCVPLIDSITNKLNDAPKESVEII